MGVDRIEMVKGSIADGKKMVSWGISILIAACLAGICIWEVMDASRTETPAVILLGDSIIGNLVDDKGINTYLEEALGREVLKGGFGGTYAAENEEEAYPASVNYQLTLVNLSKAIASGDFGAQRASVAYGDRYAEVRRTPSYFSDTVQQLAKVDFDKVEYLVIEHGTNDYNRGARLDNPQDKYDETTFGGALRSSIERIQNAYPDIQIILMTPTWCYITRDTGLLYCDETDFGGGYLEDYAELEVRIAEEYQLPFLDNYHDSGIDRDTAGLFLQDGLHLSNDGQKLIADRLAVLINELEGK